MAFWGVEVKAGKPFTLKANDSTGIKRLHLSQATLGLGNATIRSGLQCNVGNKSPLLLCVLSPQKVDSCQLNIEFEEAEDVIFSVIGPLSIHLTGYFLRKSSNPFRLNDSESESFGEDIAGTDGEKGSSDDYDYSDSFINDDDPSARGSHASSTDDDEMSIKESAAKEKEKEKIEKGGRRKMYFQIFDSDSDETSAIADDSANEASLEILNDNDHKVPKVLSSGSPLPSRVTRSKARNSTLGIGETNAKCEKTSEQTTNTDKTLDKKEDKKGCELRSTKKRKKESVVVNIDDGEGKNMPESRKPVTGKAIESSTDVLPSQNGDTTTSKKKRKRDKRERTSERKKQAINNDKAIESSTDVLPSQNGDTTTSKKKRKRDKRERTSERKKQAINNDKNTEKEFGTKNLPDPAEISSDEVRIEEIKKGKVDGKVAARGKKVSILYTGKLKDSGKLIESNLDEEAPLRFRLGGENVIKGLSIGVEGMRAGDKRRLIIPPSLGYSEENLKKESVPENAWLVYEVEAVKVR